jgi:XTP/dITP diphosphohydrolase
MHKNRINRTVKGGHRDRPGRFVECMDNVIWFLTGNEGKLAEAKHHLQPMGYDVRRLEVEGDTVVEPQASDLETVARSKLEQARSHLPSPQAKVLVEDAGLFIEALNGFPGVYSAYALDTLGCHGVLRLLAHLTSDDPVQAKRLRFARFQAVAGLWDGERMLFGVGECPGSISNEVQGEGGFGFDPVFIPADLDAEGQPLPPDVLGDVSTHGTTFGAVDVEKKQAFSHRRRALDDLLRQLPDLSEKA